MPFRIAAPVRRALPAALLLSTTASAAGAQVVRIGPGAFTPAATTITFSEQPANTVNPTYTFNAVPNLGTVSVSFAGAFVGQTVTGGSVRTLTGNPTGPLTLNTAITTSIVSDGANPTSPVLSGSPTFNGPVVMLFSQAVSAISLDGGFFDAIGGTSITAYDFDGVTIGSFTNAALGIETFGLAMADGTNRIRGLAFYITGNEPAGFAIDNVRFGTTRELVNPPNVVPEPSTYALVAAGLAGLGAAARRRRAATA